MAQTQVLQNFKCAEDFLLQQIKLTGAYHDQMVHETLGFLQTMEQLFPELVGEYWSKGLSLPDSKLSDLVSIESDYDSSDSE